MVVETGLIRKGMGGEEERRRGGEEETRRMGQEVKWWG
jgi:hypothetical protein